MDLNEKTLRNVLEAMRKSDKKLFINPTFVTYVKREEFDTEEEMINRITGRKRK